MNTFYGIAGDGAAWRRELYAITPRATIAAPEVLAFIPRIKVFCRQRAGSVWAPPSVTLRGSTVRYHRRLAPFNREVLEPSRQPGECGQPAQEVEEKDNFAANVEWVLAPSAATRLQSLAAALDVLADAREIVDIMRC